MSKQWSLMFDFPEALAKHHLQGVTMTTDNPGLALKRGYQIVRKREGIKGHRLTKFKVSVVLNAPVEEEGQS